MGEVDGDRHRDKCEKEDCIICEDWAEDDAP